MTLPKIAAFLLAGALLVANGLCQKIDSATGNNSTGDVSINTSAPAAYTQVIIKVCDKDGKLTIIYNGPPGIPFEFNRTAGMELKVYASFTGRNVTEVVQDTTVTWQ